MFNFNNVNAQWQVQPVAPGNGGGIQPGSQTAPPFPLIPVVSIVIIIAVVILAVAIVIHFKNKNTAVRRNQGW